MFTEAFENILIHGAVKERGIFAQPERHTKTFLQVFYFRSFHCLAILSHFFYSLLPSPNEHTSCFLYRNKELLMLRGRVINGHDSSVRTQRESKREVKTNEPTNVFFLSS